MDLFGTTGQQRRNWLDERTNALAEGMNYYLGPTGVPQRLNALAGLAPYVLDGQDYIDAQQASGNLFANPSLTNALAFTAPMVALAMPGVSNRLMQGAGDLAGDAAQFVADESGALRLFHGSPHDFDRFSMDKIGTGEGAQAYGHGLYFAENEGVARGYRDALTAPLIDGRMPVDNNARDVATFAVRLSGDRDRAIASLSNQRTTIAKEAADYLRNGGDLGEISKPPGRLYEVNVDANPEDFLDWDKPLSEQPPKVREIAAPFVQGMQSKFPTYNPTGDTIYRQIEGGRIGGVGGDFAASALREAGIPGIRYLDAGSRGAGDGSRNYVVFDENLISIVRKYGIAGAAAMLGMSQADVAQALGVDAATGQPMAQTPPRAE